jgi:hypothetical protein
VVVGLGEQAEEGPLGGQGHRREGLRGNASGSMVRIRAMSIDHLRRKSGAGEFGRAGVWTRQPHQGRESPEMFLKLCTTSRPVGKQ